MQISSSSIYLAVLVLVTSVCTLCTAKEDTERLARTLKEIDPCVIDATFSFIYPRAAPPTTVESLQAGCKRQAAGIACLKEKSKTSPAIIKRGMATYIAGRQRVQRKYCTNVNGEVSKKFIQDLGCIMANRHQQLMKVDSVLINTINEIKSRNFNDSAVELKYFCCALLDFKKSIMEGAGPECPSAVATMEEYAHNTVPQELGLICDDEEKMAPKCAKLERLAGIKDTFDPQKGSSAASSAIYIVATLGEPDNA